jgi:hypothetical protein
MNNAMRATYIDAQLKRREISSVLAEYMPAEILRIVCMYTISAGELLIECAQQMDTYDYMGTEISPLTG